MNESYTMKVAPTYTTVYFTRGAHSAILDEWSGRTAEDFNAGMKKKGKGWNYRTKEYTLSSGSFVEHIWEKN